MNEQTRQKIAEISQMLEDGVKSFRTSQQWMEYLTMQSRMPRYSFNNCILIMMQSAGAATMCQSFSGWKSMGRSVKKGEHGMQIICPAPYKTYSYESQKDKNGNEIRDSKGNVIMEKVCHTQMGYTVGYTFDVSQTEGKELPKICSHIDGSTEGIKELIGVLKEISPVPMYFESIDGRANGYYSAVAKSIVVDNNLSENMKARTGLHEIAHAILDLSGVDNGTSRELRETEAESIAFVVMQYLMGDKLSAAEIGQYSFGYLNSWSSTEDQTEMKAAMSTIQRTAADLINRIESVYQQREKTLEKSAETATEIQYVTSRAGAHM